MKINKLPSLIFIFFLVGCSSISTPISTPTQTEPTSTFTLSATNTFQATDLSVTLPAPMPTVLAESPVPEITTISKDNQIILKGFKTFIRWLFWSKDGKTLFIGTERNGVTIYDITNKKATANFENGLIIQDLALSRDEKTLAVVVYADNSIRFINPETGSLIRTVYIPFDWPQGLTFSPDSNVLASGNDLDREITLWDVATGREIKQLFEGDYSIRGLSFSPDGKSLVANCVNNLVRVWNTDTWNLQRTFYGDYYGFTFSPDGRKFATSGTEIQDPAVWDFNSGKKLFNLSDAQHRTTSIAYDPGGKFIVVGGANGGDNRIMNTITIWDANTGKYVRELATGYYAAPETLTFSPDGTKLASAFDYEGPGEVIIWDMNQP